jgi:transposase
MNQLKLVGIDLSKRVYQIHGVDSKGKCLLTRKYSRSQLFNFVAKMPNCTIAMEACAGAHYFSRKFQEFDHEVKLIAPQFVKPYVQGNKNDAADAEAICEAASRPKMHFVGTKQVWQQDLQTIHRIRERLVRNRTALMNEIRGILYEFGIVIPTGQSTLIKTITDILNEKHPCYDLSLVGKELLQMLYSELLEIEQKVQEMEKRLKQIATQHPNYKRLSQLGGLGLMTTTALLVALAEPKLFKNGRQFSASIGLVPRHEGTGGKNRVLGISKRGNPHLRSLLVHGARAKLRAIIIKTVKGKKLNPLEQWVYEISQRKGWNKACVALANKNARIAWAMMVNEEDFLINKASKIKKIAA